MPRTTHIYTKGAGIQNQNHNGIDCPYCFTHLLHKDNLARHVKDSHTNHMMFACPYCPRLLKTNTTLEVHISCLHGGAKKKCPDCDFMSGDPSQIHRHRRMDHGHVPAYRVPRAKSRKNVALTSNIHGCVNPAPRTASATTMSDPTLITLGSHMNLEDFAQLQPLLTLIPYELVALTLETPDYTLPNFWSFFTAYLDMDEMDLKGKILAGSAFDDFALRDQLVQIFRLCSQCVQLPATSPISALHESEISAESSVSSSGLEESGTPPETDIFSEVANLLEMTPSDSQSDSDDSGISAGMFFFNE